VAGTVDEEGGGLAWAPTGGKFLKSLVFFAEVDAKRGYTVGVFGPLRWQASLELEVDEEQEEEEEDDDDDDAAAAAAAVVVIKPPVELERLSFSFAIASTPTQLFTLSFGADVDEDVVWKKDLIDATEGMASCFDLAFAIGFATELLLPDMFELKKEDVVTIFELMRNSKKR